MKNIFYPLFLLCILITSCQPNNTARNNPATAVAAICDTQNLKDKIKVAVIIYDGVEVVDMNGPMDVFTKANYINKDRYYVYTVAAKDATVYTENCNTAIIPRYTIHTCPDPDVVVLPGCADADKMLADTAFNNTILRWVKALGHNPKKEVMAVCTGGLLLGKTGLLDYQTATTHYLALDKMKNLYPNVTVVGGVRFVDAKNFITTAGITSGIDGALHMVEKYDGNIAADSIAHLMVYNRNCPMRE